MFTNNNEFITVRLGSSSIVNEKYEQIRDFEIRDYFYLSKNIRNEIRRNTKSFVIRFDRENEISESQYFTQLSPVRVHGYSVRVRCRVRVRVRV